MSIKSLLWVAVTTILVSSSIPAESAFAQRSKLRMNQGFRYLGGGQSYGYHWRTPGPCVGYYNPYSYHNTSTWTGIIPQGAGNYMSRINQFGDSFQYSSFDNAGSLGGHSNSYNGAAPTRRPSNVVESEIESGENDSSGDGNDASGNGADDTQSILDKPESSQPSPSDDPPPVPSEEEIEEDDTSMWRGFDELESLNRRSTARSGATDNRNASRNK